MAFNEKVRETLQRARQVAARQPRRIPALDAVIAVLNADTIDRDAGRARDTEISPGAALAYRYGRRA